MKRNAQVDMGLCNAECPATIVHIPHASTVVPECIRPTLCLTDDGLRHELLIMTDWFTDELFVLPKDLATAVVFPVSRLVVDPERFTDDESEGMASRGMGAVYTKTSNGGSLRKDLSREERKGLLEAYYEPHHRFVEAAVNSALLEAGYALLVDAHSFSSKPLPHEPDQAPSRCHICVGTNDFHTPPRLVEWLKDEFEHLGLTVAINRPFAGTFVPTRLHRVSQDVISVMIEVNRSLYMDEATGVRLPGFDQFRSRLQQVLTELGARFRGPSNNEA